MTSIIRLKSACSSIGKHIIYSEMMRDIKIDDDQCNKLFYHEDTEVASGIITINENVLEDIVRDNLYKTACEIDGKNTEDIMCHAPFFFRYFIDKEAYDICCRTYSVIMSDARYFPVALDSIGKVETPYEDSWGADRSYLGSADPEKIYKDNSKSSRDNMDQKVKNEKRHHEGTDIMAGNNTRDYFPVISVSDGTIEKMGWLELGGWRIGVRSTSGAYYYYAHLAEFADGLSEGDYVDAGTVIGTMGDTGYSEEPGTTGNFDVHLHFGVYINIDGKDGAAGELSYNPYGLLKALDRYRRSFVSRQNG